MIDHNTLLYTFSTIPQVLASIIAVTIVFVFAKTNDFRSKMQREMSNVVWEFDDAIAQSANKNGPQTKQWEVWKKQATYAVRNGVMEELRDIFQDHLSLKNFGKPMQEACKNGLYNHQSYLRMLKRFAALVIAGLIIICITFLALAFTTEANVQQCQIGALMALLLMVIIAIAYLVFTALFILSTIPKEAKRKAT